MGKLFFIMGKSSTGKDSIYNKLFQYKDLNLKRVVGYTTRPIRKGEEEGRDYFFRTCDEKKQLQNSGKIIEIRTYPTVHGEWDYFTVDDGQIDFSGKNMLMIGTIDSYISIKDYYSNQNIVPIYIEVEDGIRLQRALDRERSQIRPRYEELCRRFLADADDFSKERLEACGIKKSFMNKDVDFTTKEIADFIIRESD